MKLCGMSPYIRKLEAVAEAAWGVVGGTKIDRPVSLSTLSLLALSEALEALDEKEERDDPTSLSEDGCEPA